MIAPTQSWYRFISAEEKLQQLKLWGLLSPKATDIKQFYYNGSYTDKIVQCEIVGYSEEYNDKNIVILQIEDQLHKICVDCLKDMQPTLKEAKLING